MDGNSQKGGYNDIKAFLIAKHFKQAVRPG